jgi:hypothetical protein
MHKKLRLLAVTFDTHLESWELPKFRAAIAEKVGFQHDWFHNHDNSSADNDSEKFLYRYALIQYKCFFNNPMLLCLDKGVEEAHHFFSQPDWSVRIGTEQRALPIKKLDLREYELHTQTRRTYRIYNWMPLNGQDYRDFQQLRALKAQLDFLQSKLLSHILSFAEGIGWYIEDKIVADILEFLPEQRVSFKGKKMQVFNFVFESNVPLPDMIGLGRGVSHGFGTVRPYSLMKNEG